MKWRVVIISVLVVLVSIGIVVGVLIALKGTPSTTGANTAAPVATNPSPKEVIDKIVANQTITASKNYTLQRTAATPATINADTNTIIVNQIGYSFIMNVAAEDGLSFTANDTKTSNKSAQTAAIKQTLKDAGFLETSQDTKLLSSHDTTSYANGTTACQLIDFANAKAGEPEQSIVCISGTELWNAYNKVASLLAKVDPMIAPSSKAINQKTITNGQEKLLILTAQANDSQAITNYYFATLDTDYEYLGMQPYLIDDTTSNATLPKDLKTNITNPKWGTFLTDNIK